MAYWDSMIRMDSHLPLPEEYKDVLLTESNVLALLKKRSDAVALSIDKWERILEVVEKLQTEPLPLHYFNSLAESIGEKTCALCIASTKKYRKKLKMIRYSTDKCKVCQLSALDRCTKEGSVYSKIESILKNNYFNTSALREDQVLHETKSLILQMIENLESIRLNTPI